MPEAISAVHEKIGQEERALDAEEADLDLRLEEYQRLMSLVDGLRGEFAQVLGDWKTVRRETDECKRDLRRLGWTEG